MYVGSAREMVGKGAADDEPQDEGGGGGGGEGKMEDKYGGALGLMSSPMVDPNAPTDSSEGKSSSLLVYLASLLPCLHASVCFPFSRSILL